VSEGTTRAVLAAFAGNLAIAITKAIAAYLTALARSSRRPRIRSPTP